MQHDDILDDKAHNEITRLSGSDTTMIDDATRHPCTAEREQHQDSEQASSTSEGNPSSSPPLSQWRADVLTLSARILFVLVLVMLIPAMIIAFSLQELWRLLVDVPILVLLGAIAFVPRLGFALRTTLLLGLLYGASVLWLALSGLVGSGRLYFVLLMVLAALLLNLRGTLLVGLLALLSIATIYWGFATALLPLPLEIVERMFMPATLTLHWLAQAVVSGVLIAAIVLTINRLQHSFRTAEESRAQLQRLNEQLEQRVAERTAELMQANEHLQAEITERKQAEEAYRTLVDNSLQALIIVQDGYNMFANPAAAHITGYTQEELLALLPAESAAIIHPADRAMLVQRGKDRQAGKDIPQQYNFRIIRKDGQVRWLEAFAVQTVYQGRPAAHMAYVDITERKEAEEAYTLLVEHSLQALQIFQDGRIVFTNAAATRITGYSQEEFLALSPDAWPLYIHPDDREAIVQRSCARLAGKPVPSHYEYRFIRKDGAVRWIEQMVTSITYQGRPATYMTYMDITERKQAEEALRKSEQRLKAIFDNAAVGIGLTDNAGRSILANARGAQQLGYTPEELAECSNLELTHPDDRAETVERMQRLARGDIQGYRIEKRYFRKDGSIFWADLSVSAVYDDDGQISYILGIVVDITERKQLEHQLHQANVLLQEQAIRDPLTGLHNRRYLDEALPHELHRAGRYKQSIGIIMLDIDHFKRLNDTYGHDAGDRLLRAVGVFLQHNTRGEDIVCRYGGEEFTLVLPGASHEDACQRAEELRAGIQALVVAHQGQTLDTVTASLGIAIFPAHGTRADALVRAADQALYQAKHSGRNCVVMADNTHVCC
jgi:diguanylate cyclase (GGDEF)-like protein/PAS domain S-box-containing protein